MKTTEDSKLRAWAEAEQKTVEAELQQLEKTMQEQEAQLKTARAAYFDALEAEKDSSHLESPRVRRLWEEYETLQKHLEAAKLRKNNVAEKHEFFEPFEFGAKAGKGPT